MDSILEGEWDRGWESGYKDALEKVLKAIDERLAMLNGNHPKKTVRCIERVIPLKIEVDATKTAIMELLKLKKELNLEDLKQ